MRTEKTPWEHGVVLVCENQRLPGAPKPSCGKAAGGALKALLKERLKAEGGAGAGVRVLNSSCLDLCPAHGVAVAMEPGHHAWVVDPAKDEDALVAEIQARAAPTGGARAAAKRLLGRR